MSKKGTTLIESVIAIFLTSVVVLTFLESLNVGMTGTLQLSRKTSAINIAQSQMEYIKAQTFNSSNGSIADVYGLVTATNASNTSDVINYNISGTIEFVNNSTSLQKITVNVSYLQGKQVQLIGYKSAQMSLGAPPPQGKIATDVISDMPYLPTGGFWLWGQWCGYYHVFQTSTTANISATWKYFWHRDVPCLASAGSPWILIYGPDPAYPGENRPPQWAQRDYLGNVYEDGVICRGGSFWCAGCPPAPAGICSVDWTGDYAPIVQRPPYNCVADAAAGVIICASSLTCGINNVLFPNNYELCTQHVSWYDDNNCDDTCPFFVACCRTDQYFEFSVATTSPVPAGTYTVLFFNGETTISFETVSASVTYIY